MTGLVVTVCDAACEQPVSPAASRAAVATTQAMGFTGFMEDNSTSEAPPQMGIDTKALARLNAGKADLISAIVALAKLKLGRGARDWVENIARDVPFFEV